MDVSKNTSCGCGGTATRLLYVCSGASNLGEISDQKVVEKVESFLGST